VRIKSGTKHVAGTDLFAGSVIWPMPRYNPG